MQVFENIEELSFMKFKEDSLANTNYYNNGDGFNTTNDWGWQFVINK